MNSRKKAVQNRSSAEMKAGIYKPFLTLYGRPHKHTYQITLRIDFSVPKLLYNNNFDEVCEADFDLVITTLQAKLLEMGIDTQIYSLKTASVSAIHYGKNIILTDYSTPFTYIDLISKVNLGKVYDTDQANYRNNGNGYKIRSNSFELAFYDKIRDLEKSLISPKRSFETDSEIQLGLFDILKAQPKREPFEVLRMEVRLNSKNKIKSELKKIHILADTIFQELFSKSIARMMCLHYIQSISAMVQTIAIDSSKSFINQVTGLIQNNPKIKPEKIVEYLGFVTMCNERTTGQVRQILDPNNTGKWYRLIKQYESIKKPQVNQSPLQLIIVQIQDFSTIKLNDYPQLMLNDVN